MARPLFEEPIRSAYTDYLTLPTAGYDAPILLLLNVTDVVVPSPLHGALVAQFAANGVGHRVVTGTGQHKELNAAMWAAMTEFLTQLRAAPTER